MHDVSINISYGSRVWLTALLGWGKGRTDSACLFEFNRKSHGIYVRFLSPLCCFFLFLSCAVVIICFQNRAQCHVVFSIHVLSSLCVFFSSFFSVLANNSLCSFFTVDFIYRNCIALTTKQFTLFNTWTRIIVLYKASICFDLFSFLFIIFGCEFTLYALSKKGNEERWSIYYVIFVDFSIHNYYRHKVASNSIFEFDLFHFCRYDNPAKIATIPKTQDD